jgi:hypothetical protein
MPVSPSSFASVKLPAALVAQAREAATPMRRSVAGQIEYWATLGRIAELAGLTVSEAYEAIKLYDVRQSAVPHEDQVDRIESEFVQAQATGRLAQVVSQAVKANRRQAAKGG